MPGDESQYIRRGGLHPPRTRCGNLPFIENLYILPKLHITILSSKGYVHPMPGRTRSAPTHRLKILYNHGMADHPNRKPTRLAGMNYANSGGYFITLVTHERINLFGKIVNGEMVTNEIGRIVCDEWVRSAEIRKEIELDSWCVMPNHFHAIILMKESYSPSPGSALHRSPQSLGSIVAGFKASVTRRVNGINGSQGLPVWQRNYYDHIIRDDVDMNRIREYIENNPAKWELDKEYSD